MRGRLLAKNKKAFFDHEILETFEAGIKLQGQEVKSAKMSQVKLDGSYASFDQKNGCLRLVGTLISPYKQANTNKESYDPQRSRILLLNKKEINFLLGKLSEKRLTLIPLSFYEKSGIIKVELALAKGKKKYEKRETIKKKDMEREIGRKLKS